MALRTATITAHAARATCQGIGGLTWPPLQPIAIPDPSGLDPTGPYPLRDSITSIELLSASSPITSPENRVAEYIDSRTETIRALTNTLVQLMNLLPFYFLDRDGESNVTIDNTDPDNPVTTAKPSYMRRNLDLGGFKVVDLLDGASADDLVTFAQLQAVQFDSEDNLQQILASEIIQVGGAIPMADDLDMDGGRVVNLISPPTQPQHMQPKGNFDTQITSVQTTFLARTGILAMTGGLSFQDTPTSPRYKVMNLGFPTINSDLVNLFYFEQQIALVGANDIPVGAIQPFFATSGQVPANFLICDGREVSRTIYQNLFLVIGVAYGTPSNVNVFHLPDFRGRVPIGKDNMGGTSANRVVAPEADTLGGKLGEQNHFLVTGELAGHDHTFDDAQSASGVAGALQGATATDSNNTVNSIASVTGATGSGNGHNTVQPSMAVNYIIRY